MKFCIATITLYFFKFKPIFYIAPFNFFLKNIYKVRDLIQSHLLNIDSIFEIDSSILNCFFEMLCLEFLKYKTLISVKAILRC